MKKITWFCLLFLRLNAQDTLARYDSLPEAPVIGLYMAADNEDEPEQEIAPMLQASRDGLLQAASFIWNAAGFKYREQTQNNLFLNEAPLRDYINDGSVWRWWSGLNDMIRFSESRSGIAANRHGPSNTTGYTHIASQPLFSRAGKRFSINTGNRSDLFRSTLTYNSGLLNQKWALSYSVVWRYTANLVRDHTKSSSGGMWFAVQRVFKKHNVLFQAFGAPYYREGATAESEEVIALAGFRYNSKVGLQNGRFRNIAVSQGAQPVCILSYQLQPSKVTSWRSHLQFITGKNSLQGLNYSDAANPSPVYYKYLPGYLAQTGDTATARLITEKWKAEPPQMDLDKMIQMNQLNLYSIDPHQVNFTETRARFILENKVELLKQIQFNSIFNTRIQRAFISGGITCAYQSNRRYKELSDLLGASYWLDYDNFISNATDSTKHNNLAAPNKPIRPNDRFGYDYSLKCLSATLWLQYEHTGKRFDYFIGAQGINTMNRRLGYMRNGKFPTNSSGKSEVATYITPGGKAGGVFKLNGRHFITGGASYFIKAPPSSILFPSPTSRNTLLPLRPFTTCSYEFGYEWRIPGFRGRITGFSTKTYHLPSMQTYWHDGFNSLVNQLTIYSLQKGQGIEGFVEYAITGTHLFTLSWYVGDFRYGGTATISAWQDNADTLLFNGLTAYLNNYHTANGPSQAFSCTYKYTAKRYWNIGAQIGLACANYETINPLKHTTYATSKYLDTEKNIVMQVIQQDALPPVYLTGLNGGWSKRYQRKYTLAIMGVVANLLNQRSIIRSVEALRFDPAWPYRFSNRVSISNGIQFNLSLTFSY